MSFSIRQLNPDDWQKQKQLRLEALKLFPNVFSASLEETSQRPDSMWQERLASKDQAFFGLFNETTNEIVGVTAVGKDFKEPSAALFFYSYIKPDYQGQKLSRLFYESRIAWAKENNCQNIIISHRESNIISKMANQAFGFKPTGKIEPRTWPDGVVENEIFYELKL